MKEQLLDTWDIHNKMNFLLIDHITDTGMQQSLSTRGGRTVYLQFLHLHEVRLQWLEIAAKNILTTSLLPGNSSMDRQALRKALEDSTRGIRKLLERGWDDGGKVKGFKAGVIPLLGYFISHESHHRGNILLTLKQSGEKIPDRVKWGLWEWGRTL